MRADHPTTLVTPRGQPRGRRTGIRSLSVLSVCALALSGCTDRETPEPIEPTLVFGSIGTGAGQFSYPRAIAGEGDAVIVVDKAARVQRFDAATGEPVAWFMLRDYDRGKPTGLTIGPHPFTPGKRALYLADTHYHRVQIMEMPTQMGVEPEVIARFGEYGLEPGQFVYVTDVAVTVGADGLPDRMYISEYGGNDRVTVFAMNRATDVDGNPRLGFEFLRQIGTFGDGPLQFNRPQSVVIDQVRNELIIADGCNHRLGRFTLDGEWIAWIGGPEIGAGLVTDVDLGLAPADSVPADRIQFNYPYSVVPLASGDWLVCEFGGNRVRVLDPDASPSPRVLRTYGGAGRDTGQLASPWALAVAGEDEQTAFVLDSRNNRVQAFRAPAPAAQLTEQLAEQQAEQQASREP